MRCKASETLIGTVCMPLCASVHPHLNYLALLSFYGLAVYLNVFMLECLHFSHTAGSLLLYDGCMTLQLVCCQIVLVLTVWSCANTYSVMPYG